MSVSEHSVQFYETETFLLDTLADYVGAGLRLGEVAIVLATPEHRDALADRLRSRGLNIDSARACGKYVAIDARETLSKIMFDGELVLEQFVEVAGGIITEASAARRPVRVFGELVAILAREGNPDAALRLEEYWNDLQRTLSFSLYCAYPADGFGRSDLVETFSKVCSAHSHVLPAESYLMLPTEDDRLRAITLLQQKASWLEAEIAHRKQAEERLQDALESERAARQAAEDALRWRDEFISVAAHELKTPLTSLIGNAQMIPRILNRERRLDPDRIVTMLGSITDQAGKLSRLITQLLDITRMKANKLDLERQSIDLTGLVEQTVRIAQSWSDQHVIVTSLPDSLYAEVDSLRLEQVLINLLDNAIKYSPDGGSVEVILSQLASGGIELSVRDRGLGIPLEKRDQIFERYYQAHGNGFGSGMGLGLYISREIVQLHGGDIRAEFPSDGGTQFIVTFPVRLDKAITYNAEFGPHGESRPVQHVSILSSRSD